MWKAAWAMFPFMLFAPSVHAFIHSASKEPDDIDALENHIVELRAQVDAKKVEHVNRDIHQHNASRTSAHTPSCGDVTYAVGGGVDWNAPVEMVEGVLTNPGDRTYTLVNVPSYLIGGQYVGSRTFPHGSFTWSISYNPPVSLFIWVMDIYLAGADNVLQGDGWSVEDAPGFQRSDGDSLSVWSKSFYDGTSVSVNGLNGVFVAGAVSVCPELQPPTPATPAAVGDPHLQNVHGERFDLMKAGKHVLVNIPRGVAAGGALLRVQADARRLGGHCADMYFQELNVTGSWAEAKQVGGYHYSVSQREAKHPEWVAFGKVELKIVHGRTDSGLLYLNLYVKHLGRAGFAVGGLLGEDDHEDVSIAPDACAQRLALVAGTHSAGGPEVASVAVANFD